MKRRKLGCLTTGGILALVVSLIVIGASYAFSGNKMFSPGNLNAQASGNQVGGVLSHADLEKECAACHPAFWHSTRMTELCLNCHQEVVGQLSETTSLHGAVMFGFDSINCRDCHTDHNGTSASMTDYLSDDFPHELVGFSLSAHHQIEWDRQMVCDDCHLGGFSNFSPDVCLNCHQDENQVYMSSHLELFGANCMACHDGVDTYGKDFDHNAMVFPLDGKHADVSCEDCHQAARTLADLQKTSTVCETCHLKDDAHQGVMGEQCGVCHSPLGWDQAIFDHGRTGFLLDGGHDRLECENCHADATYQGLDAACISCHAADEPHEGQFGQDCAACHVVTSWDDVTFSHDGAYAIDCIACHTENKPANHFSGQCSACHSTNAWLPASFNHQAAGATDCISCHSGNKPANHFGGQCSQCHSTNAWKPASFKHTFPLNHGGANQDCQLCHTNNNYTSYTCYGCHEHSAAEIRKEHEGVSNINNCVRCHWDGREHEDGGGDDGDDD